ncbi:Oidioi.mRNA.OKI2018_I69.chr2.g7830.t1.cds [Oikopleura dioica]|uniref:phospholipase A2 n=1 Tax=Oikopleura dioica TaxID=34765 RepID=A0ABN7TC65_OIKDI|nr:Oidioi.mRNA.OKI2018_I69.chr2.g7830.t1.cds [Oikopleura dioica]
MKFSAASLTAFVSAQRGFDPTESERVDNSVRRYFQLTTMMEHVNPEFDEKKYWTYGCNCLVLGDRPMSDPGKGQPVDELDSVCKAYKDCIKCAKKTHGEMCLPEFVEYKFRIAKSDEIICRDDKGSCGRDLCMCDKMFAQKHASVKDVFDEQYHMFWAPNGWEPAEQCFRKGNQYSDPQCCGGSTSPFVQFNGNRKECCADGSVAMIGSC